MQSTPIPAVMTITEAAAVCRCHHTTLRRAIKAGRLSCSRPGGRDIRITATQLQRWIDPTVEAMRTSLPGGEIVTGSPEATDRFFSALAEGVAK